MDNKSRPRICQSAEAHPLGQRGLLGLDPILARKGLITNIRGVSDDHIKAPGGHFVKEVSHTQVALEPLVRKELLGSIERGLVYIETIELAFAAHGAKPPARR